MTKINDYSQFFIIGTVIKEPKIDDTYTFLKVQIKTQKKQYSGDIKTHEIELTCFNNEVKKKIQEELHTGMQATFTGTIGGTKADYKNKKGDDVFYMSLYINTVMIGTNKEETEKTFENENNFSDNKQKELDDMPF